MIAAEGGMISDANQEIGDPGFSLAGFPEPRAGSPHAASVRFKTLYSAPSSSVC
jgi:hypothetical protein